jgi:hypothetical protein
MVNMSADHDLLLAGRVGRRQPAEDVAARFLDALDVDLGGQLDALDFETHYLFAFVKLILQ